jgi:predicted DNA-binding transcriptional regulator AlpA
MKRESYLSKPALARFYGVSTRTIDNWVAAKKIPEPCRLPNGRAAWPLSVARSTISPTRAARSAEQAAA